MKFGIYDTRDHCWIGNDNGPLQYEEKSEAMLAALVFDERFETTRRFQARPLERAVQLKDEVTPPVSAEDAITALERKAQEP